MSKKNPNTPNPIEIITTLQPELRILKVGTCTNVSGKHKLTYHIGCDADEVIHFRMYDNSGGGYFSTEWVQLNVMLKAIEDGPKPTTSFALYDLFKGKSVNTPAFLLAALLNEGLMQIHPDEQRCYASVDNANFYAEMKQLIAANTNIQVAPKPKKIHQRVALIKAGPVNTNLKKRPGRPYDSTKNKSS